MTIVRNKAIDRLRAQGKRVTTPIDLTPDIADDRPDAEACLLRAESDARIVACIEALPGGDATLIRTAFFEGATYAEIAARASSPLGTIKSRIRRALIRLRECLR